MRTIISSTETILFSIIIDILEHLKQINDNIPYATRTITAEYLYVYFSKNIIDEKVSGELHCVGCTQTEEDSSVSHCCHYSFLLTEGRVLGWKHHTKEATSFPSECFSWRSLMFEKNVCFLRNNTYMMRIYKPYGHML
jgi:hypothetical protein